MTPFIEMVRALGLVLLGVGRFVLGGLVTMGLSWVISFFVRKAYRRQQGDFKHRVKKVQEEESIDPVKAKILTLPAFDLAKEIKEGTFTSTLVVQTFISEIKEVNGIINAVVFPMFEQAEEEGREADAMINKAREEGTLDDLPPLLGVPISVKESFSVKGQPNTSGLIKRKDVLAEEDAIVVKNLKKAGAIVIGLTNTSELCMWYESNNPIYGRTANPYHPMRHAGGSSGGEGAILGSGASVIGVGADVGGSIRMPSYFNGIFGHKPTPLLVRNTGQYPDAEGEAVRMLSTGPMVRYATDLMPMLRIMAGPQENDNHPCLTPHHYTFKKGQYQHTDNAGEKENEWEKGEGEGEGEGGREGCCLRSEALLCPDGVVLEDIVVYFPDLEHMPLMMSRVDEEIIEKITRASEYLSSLGVEVVRLQLPELADAVEMWSCLLHVAEQPSFSQRMGSIDGQSQSISGSFELVKYLLGRSEFTLPAIALALFEFFPDLTPSLTNGYLEKIVALRKKLTHLLSCPSLLPSLLPPHEQEKSEEKGKKKDGEERKKGGGVMLLPTFPTCAKEHCYPFLRPFDFGFTGVINALHFPATQVPMGLNKEGLPIGFQVVGAPASDPVTIRIAMELEREFGGWVPPPISSLAK